MALINCPECGRKVSDRAHSCPECGYPIDKYIESLKKENDILNIEKIKKENINVEKNIAEVFYIGGIELPFSQDVVQYNEIRKEFYSIANEARRLMLLCYNESGDIENVLKEAPKCFAKNQEWAIKTCIEILYENGIQITADNFLNKYYQYISFDNVTKPVLYKCSEIINKKDNEYIRNKLRELYLSPKTRDNFIEGAYEGIMSVVDALHLEFVDNGYLLFAFDEEKAETLFENTIKYAKNTEEFLGNIAIAIQEYPYDAEFYLALYEYVKKMKEVSGDNSAFDKDKKEIIRVLQFLGMDKDADKIEQEDTNIKANKIIRTYQLFKGLDLKNVTSNGYKSILYDYRELVLHLKNPLPKSNSYYQFLSDYVSCAWQFNWEKLDEDPELFDSFDIWQYEEDAEFYVKNYTLKEYIKKIFKEAQFYNCKRVLERNFACELSDDFKLRLSKFIDRYGKNINKECLYIHDSSDFQNMKKGILITEDSIIILEKRKEILLKEITHCERKYSDKIRVLINNYDEFVFNVGDRISCQYIESILKHFCMNMYNYDLKPENKGEVVKKEEINEINEVVLIDESKKQVDDGTPVVIEHDSLANEKSEILTENVKKSDQVLNNDVPAFSDKKNKKGKSKKRKWIMRLCSVLILIGLFGGESEEQDNTSKKDDVIDKVESSKEIFEKLEKIVNVEKENDSFVFKYTGTLGNNSLRGWQLCYTEVNTFVKFVDDFSEKFFLEYFNVDENAFSYMGYDIDENQIRYYVDIETSDGSLSIINYDIKSDKFEIMINGERYSVSDEFDEDLRENGIVLLIQENLSKFENIIGQNQLTLDDLEAIQYEDIVAYYGTMIVNE